MSSTSRGGQRVADDFYESPGWTVRAILPHIIGPLAGRRILEPSAGRGAIVRELVAAGAQPENIIAIELDPVRAAALARFNLRVVRGGDEGNFLTTGQFMDRGRQAFWPDIIIANPPFSEAQDHIEHMLGILAPGGICAVLLRLAWCTGAGRAGFRKRYPFSLYPLASRPSFTAQALDWMTDEDLRVQQRLIRKNNGKTIADRLETNDEVRARMKGSDSADYAWFVWRAGRDSEHWLDGSFKVLEGKP